MPSLPTGSTAAPSLTRITASCSTAERATFANIRRPIAMFSASLAPLVRITSPSQP